MKHNTLLLLTTAMLTPLNVMAKDSNPNGHKNVSDQVITQQRQKLAQNTVGEGFGPQSPRNIDSTKGANEVIFSAAPPYNKMNLCNIHFHKNAGHAGGQFSKYAGNGDGLGNFTGYQYSGHLTEAELAPIDHKICPGRHGSLYAGNTIEVHYVYSSAQIKPGPSLSACFNESIKNPQLRVEAQVYVLVNDSNALDFRKLARHGYKDSFYQALNIPENSGTPVQYAGSTTGPDYNVFGSPFQATWSVRPEVLKVNLDTVGKWCEGNVFNEKHAHGVRNLITNLNLLSTIK